MSEIDETPAGDSPSPPDEAATTLPAHSHALPGAGELGRLLGRLLASRGRVAAGVLALAVGAPLLAAVWNLGVFTYRYERFVARLTASAEGRLAEAYVRVRAHPPAAAVKYVALEDLVRFDLHLVVEYVAADGQAVRVRVRDLEAAKALGDFAWPPSTAASRAVGLAAGEAGPPPLELRFPADLHARLATTPVHLWKGGEADWLPGRPPALDELRAALDDPLATLVRTWAAPPSAATFAVRYDPRSPNDALPAELVDPAPGLRWMATMFAGGGLLFLGGAYFALGLVLCLWGLPRRRAQAIAGAILLALPWWAPRVAPLLSHFGKTAGRAAEFFSGIRPAEAAGVVVPEVGEEEPELVREPIGRRDADGPPLLAPYRLARPAEVLDEDAAWSALVEQLASQTLALPEPQLAVLLERLARDRVAERLRVAFGFVEALRALSVSGDHPPQLRQRARDELLALIKKLPPVSDGDLAPVARLQTFARLADHPDAEVAARAREIVAQSK